MTGKCGIFTVLVGVKGFAVIYKKDTSLGGVGHMPNGSTPHGASSDVSETSIYLG